MSRNIPICAPSSLLLAALLLSLGTSHAQQTTPPKTQVEAHIDRSIAAMTLDEKISLISGGSILGSTPLPRLGIPAFRMGDGPIGAHDPSPSTAFAAGIALAATWDRTLAESIGTQIGRDSRSRGAAFLLGPGMNIYRAPMNGRNHEYFGEDPFLAGQMAVHYVEGLQSQNVTATIKHFAGNNSEFARFNSDDIVSERALREIYLPAFEAAVREGHAGAIMDAYNRVNGTFMTENAHLNTEIAKQQWHFDGLIMSDWIATHDAVASANGGLDLEMPAPLYFNAETLMPAIKSGKVKESEIDDKVRRLLRVAARFGWITPATDGPGWVSHDPLDIDIPRYNQQGRAIALQGALESATLLKNDGNLLPLDPARVRKIAVIGPDANPGYATGGGSGMVPRSSIPAPSRASATTSVPAAVSRTLKASTSSTSWPRRPASPRPPTQTSLASSPRPSRPPNSPASPTPPATKPPSTAAPTPNFPPPTATTPTSASASAAARAINRPCVLLWTASSTRPQSTSAGPAFTTRRPPAITSPSSSTPASIACSSTANSASTTRRSSRPWSRRRA
jgi:beta-glucosidase-like glycosyl hydrolase